jgi:hypothetical protein
MSSIVVPHTRTCWSWNVQSLWHFEENRCEGPFAHKNEGLIMKNYFMCTLYRSKDTWRISRPNILRIFCSDRLLESCLASKKQRFNGFHTFIKNKNLHFFTPANFTCRQQENSQGSRSPWSSRSTGRVSGSAHACEWRHCWDSWLSRAGNQPGSSRLGDPHHFWKVSFNS